MRAVGGWGLANLANMMSLPEGKIPMTNQMKRSHAKTYLPGSESPEEFQRFLSQIEHFANKQTKLISSEGDEVLLPEPLFDVLRRVADALAGGNGVTVMPRQIKLTTQQAADVLGTSRPTLIKLLEGGSIPFEVVGRHRKVTLGDLENYQQHAQAERRAALQRMAREGQAAGMLETTHSDLPPRR